MNDATENLPLGIYTEEVKKEKLPCTPFCSHVMVSRYVTWSRGMTQMSLILILSCRLKEVINSCFILLGTSKNCPYLRNQMSERNGVWIKMVAFQMDKKFMMKIQNWILSMCDLFPWLCHILYPQIKCFHFWLPSIWQLQPCTKIISLISVRPTVSVYNCMLSVMSK